MYILQKFSEGDTSNPFWRWDPDSGFLPSKVLAASLLHTFKILKYIINQIVIIVTNKRLSKAISATTLAKEKKAKFVDYCTKMDPGCHPWKNSLNAYEILN